MSHHWPADLHVTLLRNLLPADGTATLLPLLLLLVSQHQPSAATSYAKILLHLAPTTPGAFVPLPRMSHSTSLPAPLAPAARCSAAEPLTEATTAGETHRGAAQARHL